MKNKLFIVAPFAIALASADCNKSNPTDESSAAGDNTPVSTNTQMQSVKAVVTNAWQKTKEATSNAWSDVKESVQSTTNFTYDQKDAFVAKAEADLGALDEKIKELSEKAGSVSGSTTNEIQTKLQDLRDQRAALDQKMDAVKNATEADWDEVKTGFQNAYASLKDSVKQAWDWLNTN